MKQALVQFDSLILFKQQSDLLITQPFQAFAALSKISLRSDINYLESITVLQTASRF